MDQPNTPIEITAPNTLIPYPKPGTNLYTVFDVLECYADEEHKVNMLLGLGFEPYAITCADLDESDKAISKLKLRGVPTYRPKQWFRRERERSSEEMKLIELAKEKV